MTDLKKFTTEQLQAEIEARTTKLPLTIDFSYYVRDSYTQSEFQEVFEDLTGHMISDELLEKIESPFYEVKLDCTLNTETGKITIHGVVQ